MTTKPAVFTVTLERDGVSLPWGFRLSGGGDLDYPLVITKVNECCDIINFFPFPNFVLYYACLNVIPYCDRYPSEVLATAFYKKAISLEKLEATMLAMSGIATR